MKYKTYFCVYENGILWLDGVRKYRDTSVFIQAIRNELGNVGTARGYMFIENGTVSFKEEKDAKD